MSRRRRRRRGQERVTTPLRSNQTFYRLQNKRFPFNAFFRGFDGHKETSMVLYRSRNNSTSLIEYKVKTNKRDLPKM